MGRIAVVGSINMDMVMYVDRVPTKGETINGTGFLLSPGGKGANQAVAASMMGAEVFFFGKVGNDAFARELFETLQKKGVSTEFMIQEEDVSTGTASITVHEGDNTIILNQGANAKVTVDYISGYLELLRAMDIVVLQNEIPLETTRFICKELCDSEVKVLFDPAPFEGVDPVEFLGVDYFTPNETECKALTGYDTSCSESIYQSLKYLQDIGIKTPIITMGKNGVAYIEKGVVERVKAYRVDAMDSTAAGDTFSGALAAELADGKTVKEAIKFANAAAAITTTRIGAQKSIPTRQEVLDWLIEKSDLR